MKTALLDFVVENMMSHLHILNDIGDIFQVLQPCYQQVLLFLYKLLFEMSCLVISVRGAAAGPRGKLSKRFLCQTT